MASPSETARNAGDRFRNVDKRPAWLEGDNAGRRLISPRDAGAPG